MRRTILRLTANMVVLLFALFGIVSAWLIATYLRETGDAARDAPPTGAFVATERGRIFTQAEGPAPAQPVIFVHGTAAWSGFWRGTITRIGEAGYRAIAIDLPPFGFSERDPAGGYGRQDQATRLIALVEAMAPARPIIVGHSFGAGPVIEAVMKRPDLFAGLVIVAGALGLPEEGRPPARDDGIATALISQPFIANLAIAASATNPWLTRYLLSTMIHRKEAATPEVADVLRRPQRLAGTTQAYAQWLPVLFRPERTALSGTPANLRALPVPTAVIWGREDTLTPLPQGERVASLIPGATLDVLDGVGHIPHLEAPASFERLLLQRLEGMARPGG
jgi:pimeloyl-ACP methyl ester carboxylesterase